MSDKIDRYDYSKTAPTWSKLLKAKQRPEPVLAQAPNGKAVKLYRIADLKKAAKKAGVKLPTKATATKPKASSSSSSSKAKDCAADALPIAAHRIATDILEAGKEFSAILLRQILAVVVAEAMDGVYNLPEELGAIVDKRLLAIEKLVNTGEDKAELLKAISEAALLRLVGDSAASYRGKIEKALAELAKEAGLDPGSYVRQAKAELEAKAKAEAKAAAEAKKAAKAKSGKATAKKKTPEKKKTPAKKPSSACRPTPGQQVMDMTTLTSILATHARWLDGDGGARADLRGADLRGAELRGADLRYAELPGARRRGALARSHGRSDLRYADLRSSTSGDAWAADLRGADLRERLPPGRRPRAAPASVGAVLRYAELRGVNL